MLDGLRKYSTSWAAQGLLGLLVLSFGAWGVNDVFNGFGTNDVAVVGSTPITVTDFKREYDQTVQNLSEQIGQQLTPEMAQQFQIPTQILGRLVSQATLDNAARGMGIGISNAELGKKIAADSTFRGRNGAFDRGVLTQVVRQNGYTEDDYILSQRRVLTRSQLAQAFAGGVTSPVVFQKAVHDYQTEERDVRYITLTAPAASEIADPSDTDLNAYYEAHKTDWDAPEVRGVTYVLLSPTEVAQVDEVSDEDAKKAYDAAPARFTTPEKRRVQQIVFKDRADADQAALMLGAGTTFDGLILARSLKPSDVDLGQVTKDKIVDPKVADAAFGLALNTVSPIVEGQFGPVMLRVTEIQPTVTTTFDQAKADLKKEIATQRGVAEVTAAQEAIEDARAGGASLAEVAAKYGLKVQTVAAVDAQGKDANGDAIANLPSGLVPAVFQTDVGNDNAPIQPDASSYVWYDVTAVTAPHTRALAEVRDKVVAAWKDGERTKRLADAASAAKQRLDNKEDFAAVAASLNVPVKTATKLIRSSAATEDLSAPAIVATFGGPQGLVAEAEGVQPMTRVLMVVDKITVPEFNETAIDIDNSKQALDSQYVNAILSLYVGQLQKQTKVSFHQNVIQQVIGLTDTTAQ